MAAMVLATGGCRGLSGKPRVAIRGTTWTVDLATTPEQRYQGLSGRGDLPEGTGMLFVYPSAQVLEFCMRGCRIPLDIAFIGPDMRVVRTHTMAIDADPLRPAAYGSFLPAQFAMEAPAGSLRRAGVRVGDEVAFSGVPEPAKAMPDP